jgi:hypothetical protein
MTGRGTSEKAAGSTLLDVSTAKRSIEHAHER